MLRQLFRRRAPEYGHGDPVWLLRRAYGDVIPRQRVVLEHPTNSAVNRTFITCYDARSCLRLCTADCQVARPSSAPGI